MSDTLQHDVGSRHIDACCSHIRCARSCMLESRMPDIAVNLERVRERIARAAERAGRRGDDVLLIGVSKTVEVERIRAAVAAGLRVLGENRVQEAKVKIAELGRPAAWHLIGHLQTNKVKDALELFDVIHSLDRVELAHELQRRAAARTQVVEALLQVNVAGEPSKGGFGPETVGEALDAIGKLPHVQVTGLMAIPPEVERAEEGRPWFRRMRALAERHGLRRLSMGMSGDFEVAIEEGATMVRVGTAIFGPRPPRTAGA
jgi:pyridoxal phosphate enzyme (YggS family)